MDPCKICGGTDLNLVDGFYYCVECGTQDVNIQETIVEQTALGDGTFAHATTKKFTTVAHDGIEMSGEWHKWHIFNFILAGLTEELMALGAKPSLKMKVLWVWTRYMKEFQDKDEQKNKLDIDDEGGDDDDTTKKGGSLRADSGNDESDEELKGKTKKVKCETFSKDIKVITKGTLLTILYVALNLDRSDIQLSHLFRFINEGRLSMYNFMKFVPKELNTKAIKNWKSFTLSKTNLNLITLRALAMTCFKRLQLGVPLVPDLSKLVKNYVQELCLPVDVANLVFALMRYVPIDFMDVDLVSQKRLVRIPDYEGACMAYILIALKMCFGLDGEYEVKLSQIVDKINDDENYPKSYKFGLFPESSDRLFSFVDWCEHLQFRKLMLCKNYLPMAKQFNAMSDDYVFMEHLEKRKKREIKLSDNVTMDILNKIKSYDESEVIPKDEFSVSLTPLTSYVDVMAQYVHDPDVKLLLCEDFRQYSLTYALQDLKLPNSCLTDTGNPIVGVSELGKIFNNHIIGTLKVKEGDTTLVYVRNCQNKNWLKTKPPTADHVTKENQNENGSDKESDHGYDSNFENSVPENEMTHVTVNDESVDANDKLLQIKDSLDDGKSIFDDNFNNMSLESLNEGHVTIKEENIDNCFEIDTRSDLNIEDSKIDSFEDVENRDVNDMFISFDPNKFDREKMINELIELERKKYKISVRKESTLREPRKRKLNLLNDEAGAREPKKKRTENRSKPGEIQQEVNELISAYYNNIQNDLLNRISERVKTFIGNPNNLDTTDANQDSKELEVSTVDQNSDVMEASTVLNVEENESQTKMDTNANCDEITANSQEDTNPIEQHPISDIREDDNDEVVDDFLKSDPNFDEKDHDINQLYVKLAEGEDATDISIDELEKDPEIDKIIQRHIVEFTNTDKCALGRNKITDVIGDIHDNSDSDDDVLLSVLKETICIEQENKSRKNKKLETLIRDPSNVKEFKYWVRHYKSRSVERSTDMTHKFCLELNENLPISFVLVIRECAAMLGCSMFSLYKHMQNIEEILIV